jgi:hypothetical protein
MVEKTINSIIEDEFDFLKIGTKHNTDRAKLIMSNMINSPGKSILSQSASRSEAKAAYQFFNNERLNLDEIRQVHRYRTIERIADAEESILVIQDSSSANYDSQHQKDNLCKLNATTKGLKIHSSIATTQEGLNLGILYQDSYGSESESEAQLTKAQKKKRPIEEKESYRWIESFYESMILIPYDIDVTVISDREGDIYEYMDAVISKNRYFLTRIAQNRMTTDNEKIFDNIKKTKSKGEVCVQVPRNSAKNIPSRETKMEIRFKKFNIIRPSALNNNTKLPKSLTVNVIHAIETNHPDGIEPIEWFLMTNREITNLDEAVQQMKNYVQRWKIERFHYVLKSGGCNIEDIQARTSKVTLSLIMIYSIISVFIMNMTYAARLTPDIPCTDFFEEDEWKFLYALAYKTTEVPDTPISIKEAVKLIAWIGSGKRSPSDGDPGLKLVWRGLEKFYLLYRFKDFTHTYIDSVRMNKNTQKLTVQG